MKPLKLIVAGLIVLLLFAGCVFDRPVSGTVSMHIPTRVSARSNSSRTIDLSGCNWIQVYLLRNGKRLPIGTGGAEVLEMQIPTDRTVKIPDIDSGAGYYLYVALAQKTDAAAAFRPKVFGESDVFAITAGIENTVVVSVDNAPEWVGTGSNLSVVTLDGVLYQLSGSTVTTSSGGTYSLDSNYTAYSLSVGWNFELETPVKEVWVNTDKGIVPLRPGCSAGVDFKYDLMTGNNTASVKSSGAINFVTGEGNKRQAIFYQKPGNIGGALIDSTDPANWDWFDMKNELSKETGENADLGQYLDYLDNLTTDVILDYDIKDTYGYFVPATALPLFPMFVSTALVDSWENTAGESPDGEIEDPVAWMTENIIQPNTISLGDVSDATITAVSGTEDKLYVGTNKGIYRFNLNADKSITEADPTLVPNSPKYDVIKLKAIKASDGTYWVAAVTRKGTLAIIKNLGIDREYRFFSGVPQSPDRVEWFKETGSTNTTAWVYVTGSNGAARVPVFSY